MATFWEIAARSVSNLFSLYFVCNIYLFPALVLRAGFAFRLLQLLFIAFLLLFIQTNNRRVIKGVHGWMYTESN